MFRMCARCIRCCSVTSATVILLRVESNTRSARWRFYYSLEGSLQMAKMDYEDGFEVMNLVHEVPNDLGREELIGTFTSRKFAARELHRRTVAARPTGR
jgi:hypothetical protein